MILVGVNEKGEICGYYPIDLLEVYKNLPNKSITIDEELHQYLLEKQYKIENLDETKKLYTINDKDLFIEVEPIYQEMPKSEIELLKEENETLKLALADLDTQRQQDKLDTQLAIAELTSTLMGGE
jgi:hypothetical protein